MNLPFFDLAFLQKPLTVSSAQQSAWRWRSNQLAIKVNDDVCDAGFGDVAIRIPQEDIIAIANRPKCPFIDTALRGLVIEVGIRNVYRLGRQSDALRRTAVISRKRYFSQSMLAIPL